jgi:hypothetical protein
MDRERRARARRPGEADNLPISWKMAPVIKAVKAP